MITQSLVDPAIRRPSMPIILPQQQEWREAAIASNLVLKQLFNNIPSKIIHSINSVASGAMKRESSEKYRLELLDGETLRSPYMLGCDALMHLKLL